MTQNDKDIRPRKNACFICMEGGAGVGVGLHPNQHWRLEAVDPDSYLVRYKNISLCLKESDFLSLFERRK